MVVSLGVLERRRLSARGANLASLSPARYSDKQWRRVGRDNGCRRAAFFFRATKRVNSLMPFAAEQICVVIGRTRHKMVQIEIQEAAKRGARLIELRLDFLAKAPDFKRLLGDKPCPLIATFRRPQDGGRWGGSEEDRLM